MRIAMDRFAAAVGTALLAWCSVSAAQTAPPDPWQALDFLVGSWSADAEGAGGAAVVGHYRFGYELGHHVLARHAVGERCKGPDDFDCDHGDLLYVYQDAPGEPLRAIYFDNEGHVLHYVVETPGANRVVFASEPGPGPAFRLTYARDGSVMRGAFQMRPPGQEWRSYLQWSGARE